MKRLAQRGSDRAANWRTPWTGGSRLITMWDMKEYLAKRLVDITHNIVHSQLGMIDDPEIFPNARKKLEKYIGEVWTEAQFLGLPSTARQAQRLYHYLNDAAKTSEEIGQAGDELQTRFNEEIESIKLFHVPSDKLDYYNKTELFGYEFKTLFPLANSEIIEAGNCFAFDRFTACVFHLMRAMELALRVLFVSLGMPPRIWSTTKWSQISKRIDGKIEKNNKILATDPAWQKDQPFYENASAFVAAVRAPMRNATMHVESVYDEAGAENVFGAVKSFMRHLATKLKESP